MLTLSKLLSRILKLSAQKAEHAALVLALVAICLAFGTGLMLALERVQLSTSRKTLEDSSGCYAPKGGSSGDARKGSVL